MGNGFQFLDIIFFALIAAFLVLRLRSVLGRRDGHAGKPRDPFNLQRGQEADNENVVQLPDREKNGAFEEMLEADAEADDPLTTGLMQIRRADRSFDPEEFLVGARTAFEMIVSAFAAGDKESLEAMLSPDVYGNFADEIDKRAAAGESLETVISAIRASEMVEAYMEGRMATITVKFVSDQTNLVRDASGKITSGDPREAEEVTDFWTFARDIRARDPNWTLVATGSLD
jgi:predicted lipid-binding transport protein (Tim44 family)